MIQTDCVGQLIRAGLKISRALSLVGYPKSSWYRHQRPTVKPPPIPQAERDQPQALRAAERAEIAALLSTEEHAGLSVQQTFWRVFDAGHYIASQRTWYRIAAEQKLSGDRRRHSTHPPKTIPELMATGPNQVWSWDITRIPIASQKTALHLYLIEDVFSRKPVGWRLEHDEVDQKAKDMIAAAITAEGCQPHTLHSDGGPSMTSNTVAAFLSVNGIDVSRSRPHVSNDNPYSESMWRTLKYDLEHPASLVPGGKFRDYQHALEWITAWIDRYLHHHRHSGLNGYTPAEVHNGTWPATAAARQSLLNDHHSRHRDRYRKPPQIKTPPGTVWINKPAELSQPG